MKLAPESLDGDAPGDADVPEAATALSPAIVLSNPVEAAPRPIALDTLAPSQELQPDEVTRSEPPAPEIEVIVPEGTVYTGEALRRAREARGLTMEQICERTRITRQHVENIEADRYELLPAPVYLRGILMALAKQLRLDGQKVARSYMAACAADRPNPR